MNSHTIRFALLVILLLTFVGAAGAANPQVEAPQIVLAGVPFEIKISGLDPGGRATLKVTAASGEVLNREGTADQDGALSFSQLQLQATGSYQYQLTADQEEVQQGDLRTVPGWLSLTPPIVAVVLAIAFRQVILALLTGIWLGAIILYDWNPLIGFLRVLDKYIVNAYTDSSHMIIILFTLLLGGMVGIISKSGGTLGLIAVLSKFAKSSSSTQLATWVMGILIFFDDYANTLFVGTSMRPLCDRYRVSREKLSYLIDTTAAPVANIAFISTWIGFEVSLIGDAFAQLGVDRDPYLTFLYSIPYRFYPILALTLALLLVVMKRDFGAMHKAEMRSRTTGRVLSERAIPLADYESSDLMPAKEAKAYWQLAIFPIVLSIIAILGAMLITGYQTLRATGGPIPTGITWLREVLANADSYKSLLWGSAAGAVIAGILALATKALDLRGTIDAWVAGARSVFLALIILGLAWSIGSICADLKTANYLVHFLGPKLSPYWIPALTTVVSAAISFAVGSSWATMSIVMPLVIPLIYFRTAEMGVETQSFFMIATISSVLAGSTFGDHASPISDTTILSSIFSGADHIDHVRTQVPYALVAGVIAILIGDLATAYGLPVWMALLLSIGLLVAVVRFFGKPVPEVGAMSDS